MFLLSILLSLFGTIGTVKADTDEDIAFIFGISFLVVLIYILPGAVIHYYLQDFIYTKDLSNHDILEKSPWPNISGDFLEKYDLWPNISWDCAVVLERILNFSEYWPSKSRKVLDFKIKMEYSIKEYHPGDFLISASDNYLLYLLDIEKTFLAIQKNMTDSKKVDQFFSSIESLFGLDTDFHFMYNECSKILLLNNEASLYLELIEAFEQIQAFINAGIVNQELLHGFFENVCLILIFIIL